MLAGINTSSQSPGSAVWGQIQQQQAQRNADQSASQARALRAQASEAQSNADQAQQAARALKAESSQAQVAADAARLGLAALKTSGEVLTRFGAQVARINVPQATAATVQAPPEPTQPAVVNAYGQQTGTLLSVTA